MCFCDGVGPGNFKGEHGRSNISNRAARPEDLAWFWLFFSSREEIRPVSISMMDINMSTRPARGERFFGFIIQPYVFLKPFPGLGFSLSPYPVLTLQIKTGFNGVLNKGPVDPNPAAAVAPLHIKRGADWSLSGERSAQRSSSSNESIMVCCQRPLPACAWEPVIWGEHFNLICFVVCKGAFREIKKIHMSSHSKILGNLLPT